MTREYATAGPTSADDLLTDWQVSEMTPFERSTLRKWRLSWPNGDCRGPMPVKVEGRVFYRRRDVEAWLRGDQQTTGG